MTGTNTYSGPTAVSGQLIVAIPSFAALGTSSVAPTNLQLGGSSLGRGTLLYTGTAAAPSTTRGATVYGQYFNGDGGAIGVQNAGTSLTWAGQITGSGSFIKTGAGTLVLTNTTNNFTGGTYVEGGTLAIGASGPVLPAGGNVTINSGGTLSLGGFSNTAATALGSVEFLGGTLTVPTGAGDYYLNQLIMDSSTVDFTGSSDFRLHFVNANLSVVIPAYSTVNWIGAGTSRILNDTPGPLTVSLDNYAVLNEGVILSAAGANPNFTFSGNALTSVRLSNTGNTANITVESTQLFSSDLSTDVGHGAFGTLGTGTLTLEGGSLVYDGPTASCAKPVTLTVFGGVVGVAKSGTNLTMTSVISESPANSGLGLTNSGFHLRHADGQQHLHRADERQSEWRPGRSHNRQRRQRRRGQSARGFVERPGES
jgi:autotransporter-associated beta strand protein